MSMPTNPARPTYIVVKMRACDLQPGDVFRRSTDSAWQRVRTRRINDYGEFEIACGEYDGWELAPEYELVDVQERVQK